MARLMGTVPVPRATEAVQLELTVDEADALEAILSSISGPPHSSRRGLCDNILRELQSVDMVRKGHGDLDGRLGFTRKHW